MLYLDLLSLFNHHLHAFCHGQCQGYLICDVLTSNQTKLVSLEEEDDSHKGFQRSQMLTEANTWSCMEGGPLTLTFSAQLSLLVDPTLRFEVFGILTPHFFTSALCVRAY